MKGLRIALWVAAAIAVVVAGFWFYSVQIANPRTVRELLLDPDGERARRVMLITLPSGRRLPVNFLRERDLVYAAADGTWWKELVGDGFPVTLVVRGDTLSGRARAILDDPLRTKDVFTRLRPDALEGFGTLIEIELDPGSPPPAAD